MRSFSSVIRNSWLTIYSTKRYERDQLNCPEQHVRRARCSSHVQILLHGITHTMCTLHSRLYITNNQTLTTIRSGSSTIKLWQQSSLDLPTIKRWQPSSLDLQQSNSDNKLLCIFNNKTLTTIVFESSIIKICRQSSLDLQQSKSDSSVLSTIKLWQQPSLDLPTIKLWQQFSLYPQQLNSISNRLLITNNKTLTTL